MQPIEPQVLTLIDELDSLRTGRDDAWQIPRGEGEVLFQIALLARARVIVEVGTSYGFSGLFWAAALSRLGGNDRVLHTIDISQKKYDASREVFARAGWPVSCRTTWATRRPCCRRWADLLTWSSSTLATRG